MLPSKNIYADLNFSNLNFSKSQFDESFSKYSATILLKKIPTDTITEVSAYLKISQHFPDHNFIFEKFSWQKGYAAFSVSQYNVDSVFEYIKKQKIKQESLEEEGIKL